MEIVTHIVNYLIEKWWLIIAVVGAVGYVRAMIRGAMQLALMILIAVGLIVVIGGYGTQQLKNESIVQRDNGEIQITVKGNSYKLNNSELRNITTEDKGNNKIIEFTDGNGESKAIEISDKSWRVLERQLIKYRGDSGDTGKTGVMED